MATAEAGVCNVALLRVGHTQTINSLDDPSAAAKACKTLWDFTRDELLQARPWPFATKRASLAAITDGERDGYAFAYSLPADFLAARYLWPGLNNPGKEEAIPFRLEADASKQILLTDEEDAKLVYTAKVTEVGRWSPMFRNAMAMRLAADLALGVAKKPTLGVELHKLAIATLGAAHASSANQQQTDSSPVSEFESGRR